MKKLPYGKLIAVGIFVFTLFIFSSDAVVDYFRSLMEGSVLGPFAYFAVLVVAVVVAPVAALPLIPLAASLFGPFATGVLSVIGYTVGGIIAFLLAQRIGQPVLRYFISLEQLEKIEKKVPPQASFLGIVLLRMAVPVDLLSYALGLFSTIPLRTYALATLIGVTPFSFIFAYGGQALADRSFPTLIGVAIVGSLLFFFAVRKLRALHRDAQSGDQSLP